MFSKPLFTIRSEQPGLGVAVGVGVLVGVTVTVGEGMGVGGKGKFFQIKGRKAIPGKPGPICTEPSTVVPGTLCPDVFPNDAAGLLAEKPALANTVVGGFFVLRMMLSTTPSGNEARGTRGSRMKQSISPSASVMSGEHWPENSLGKMKLIELGIVSSYINQFWS